MASSSEVFMCPDKVRGCAAEVSRGTEAFPVVDAVSTCTDAFRVAPEAETVEVVLRDGERSLLEAQSCWSW
jgi:hypothetical protein